MNEICQVARTGVDDELQWLAASSHAHLRRPATAAAPRSASCSQTRANPSLNPALQLVSGGTALINHWQAVADGDFETEMSLCLPATRNGT